MSDGFGRRHKFGSVFPYSLEHKNINRTNGNATNPLFINIESFDSPEPQNVKVEIMLPQG